MDINQIKEVARLIVKNFSGQKKIFLFGSTARDLEVNEDTFSESQDLDLLFEVDPEVFEQYCQICQSDGFDLFGQPHDPFSAYWGYYSLSEMRWDVIRNVFEIDTSLSKEIVALLGGKKVDIILFPFDWENNNEILNAINARDPKFSQNIQGDKKLLFEK